MLTKIFVKRKIEKFSQDYDIDPKTVVEEWHKYLIDHAPMEKELYAIELGAAVADLAWMLELSLQDALRLFTVSIAVIQAEMD